MTDKLLTILLQERIDQEGISWREASQQIGVSITTVTRVLRG